MAPSRRQPHGLKVLVTYMGKATEQESLRNLKRIAASPEFKGLLFQLAEAAPSTMKPLLKCATRKCDDSEHHETAKKRAKQANSNERISKRPKITHSMGKETSSSRKVPEMDSMVQVQAIQQEPQKACMDVRNEDLEEDDGEDLDAVPKENELVRVVNPSISIPPEGDNVHLPTQYQIECGLTMETRETPSIKAFVTARLLTLKPSTTRPHFNINDEITKILRMLPFLEAETTKRGLLQYLENRKQTPGGTVQARITWNVTNPSEILDALAKVELNTFDNKIHRAYGQTMLFSSVNAQVAGGYKSTFAGHRSDHTALLEDLARKKAGSVSKSEIDQMINRYSDEYYAGQKWSAVIDWFGGNGIVLVFVTAEIGSNYVERKWTEFQRKCLKHIAELLPNIRALVAALGSDALDLYCQHGCLGQACIDRVDSTNFTEPDDDDEELADDSG